MNYQVAAIQMTSGLNVTENLKQAGELIKKAVATGAKLIVLPEMFPIMGNKNSDKLVVKEKFGTGVIQNFLEEQAKKYKIWLVGGTIPIETQNPNKIRAAALIYNDQGKVIGRYDKMHLFDVFVGDQPHKESKIIEHGDSPTIVSMPLGNLAVAVCYDIRFPDFTNYLANQNAQIIAVPTAFTQITGAAHWDILIRSLAIQTQTFVIAACQAGVHANGRHTYGHSVIVDPWGVKLAEKIENTPGYISAEIDLARLQKIRSDMPLQLQRRKMPG